MKLFEVDLHRSALLRVAGHSEEEVERAVAGAELDGWDIPEWEVYATDLVDEAKTEAQCDRLLAGPLPDAVVRDGIVMAVEDVPGVWAAIEEAIRERKAQIYMDAHQMKLPGFE